MGDLLHSLPYPAILKAVLIIVGLLLLVAGRLLFKRIKIKTLGINPGIKI